MNAFTTPARSLCGSDMVAALIFAAVAAQVWLFWSLPILPFIDLPNHLPEAYVCGRHAARAAAVYHPVLTAYQPSYLHAFFCAQFVNIETGNAIRWCISRNIK